LLDDENLEDFEDENNDEDDPLNTEDNQNNYQTRS
jgi:hypothetical protein